MKSKGYIPTSRNMLRIGFYLVAVSMVLVSAYAIMTGLNAVKSPRASSIQPQESASSREPGLVLCTEIQRCNSIALSGITPTPNSTQGTTTTPDPTATNQPATPIPTPSSTPVFTPTATITPDPTPIAPLLQVLPTHLSISQKTICNLKKTATLQLINAGGTALVWLEDVQHSSPGITISDPTRSYLLLPGQSVNAVVGCRRNLPADRYFLRIDYNGGYIDTPVIITV